MKNDKEKSNIQKACDGDMTIYVTKGPCFPDRGPQWKIILNGSCKWVAKSPRLKSLRSTASVGSIHLCRQWDGHQQRCLTNELSYYGVICTVSQWRPKAWDLRPPSLALHPNSVTYRPCGLGVVTTTSHDTLSSSAGWELVTFVISHICCECDELKCKSVSRK